MQLRDGRLRLSPSDLNAFLECEHLTRLELELAHGRELVEDAEAIGELEHVGAEELPPPRRRRLVRAGVPEGEILVVAPYNAQVRCLREALPASVRVGTVDRFQGQEADVVFFSMASSSGEDVRRNVEFLFSRNRLNVAVSRARCLAYVVASPRLLEVVCHTIEQMRMVNALCLAVEMAEGTWQSRHGCVTPS